MKYGKSLQELAMELDRQAKVKHDYLIDTRELEMHMPAPEADPVLRMHSLVDESLLVNDIAHRQIGQNLSIPARYYDKMRTENPDLLAANVNSWFQHDPSIRMVRTLDSTARAFLSDRYRRIDNFEVAQTVLPIIGGMDGASVESCELTDSRRLPRTQRTAQTQELP